MRQKIKNRLRIHLTNLAKSGAGLDRLIKVSREAGLSETESERVAGLYYSNKPRTSESTTARNRKKSKNRRGRSVITQMKSSIQSLMEAGGSYDQALSLAIRGGLQRQRAIKLVNEAFGRKVKSPWVSVVSGGSVTPK